MLLFLPLLLLQVGSTAVKSIYLLYGQNQTSSLQGSIYGGSVLHFYGDYSGMEASDLSVTISTEACPVNDYHFTSGYFECTVPASSPSFSSQSSLQVSSPSFSMENSPGIPLSFDYSFESTPMVIYMNPSEATPGDTIAFVGRWMTYNFQMLVSGMIGAKQVTILANDTTYLGMWSPYNVSAIIGDNVHGDTGPSMLLYSGYSGLFWQGRQFTPSGSPYWFRTLARVDSISYNAGSFMGGLSLEITGAGFPTDSTPITVSIGSGTCTITQVTYNTIQCTTTAGTNPVQSVYQGNVGLIRNFWNNTLDSMQDLIANTVPDLILYHATTEIRRDEYFYTRSQIYGLFLAPKTGDYVFYIASDDGAQVFLSTDSTTANKQSIINFSGYTELKQKFYHPGTSSAPVPLQAGEAYYLEIWQYNNGGSGHFDMGVQVPGDGTKPNKLPLMQQIVIQPEQIVREVQNITIIGKNANPHGTLRMTYGSVASKAVTITEGIWACSDIVSALNYMNTSEIFSCASAVSGYNVSYAITFNSAATSTRPLLSAEWNKLQPSGTYSMTERTPGSTGISGNFTVCFAASCSDPISVGINSEVQLAYNINSQLPSVMNSLLVYGSMSIEVFNYTFYLPSDMVQGMTSYFTLDITNITGGGIQGSATPDNAVWITQNLTPNDNDQYFNVIPSEFLRTYQTAPQLTVEIDSTGVICAGNCTFTYLQSADLPAIASFSESDQALTFQGTGFDSSSLDNYQITVGSGACSITEVTSTSITCTLGVGVAGSNLPQVVSVSQGLVPMSSSRLLTTAVVQILSIASISPNQAGMGGGISITVTGTGFDDSLTDTAHNITAIFGNSPCAITGTSTTSFTCRLSAYTNSSVITVTIDSAYTVTSELFTYTPAPSISAVSPSSGSPITTTTFVITGENFSQTVGNVNVSIGDLDCLVTQTSLTSITCDLLGGPPDTYTLSVSIADQGLALFGAGVSNQIGLLFTITSISPLTGSIYGGTNITVTGTGFSMRSDFMSAFIGNSAFPCSITPVSSTSFTCVTSAAGLSNDVSDTFYLYGRLTDLATCLGNCNFTRSTIDSPTVTSITSSAAAEANVTIQGSGFGVTLGNVVLSFNDVMATVISVSDAEIIATMPSVQGMEANVALYISDRGNSNEIQSITNTLTVTSVQPLQVSPGGGIITIYGSGFVDTDTITFGSIPCSNPVVSDTSLTCILSADTNTSIKPLYLRTFACTSLSTCGVAQVSSLAFSISSSSSFLEISGSFPPSISTSSVQVTLSSYSCPVASISSTTINCTPDAPPGTYSISVYIQGYGYNSGSATAVIALTTASINTLTCSYQGGCLLQIAGTGLHESVAVTICNNTCTLVEALGNSYTCTVPPLVTTYSQQNFNIQSAPLLIANTSFAIIASNLATADNAYDGDDCTFFTDTSNSVYVGIDAGSGVYLQLSEVSFIGGGTDEENYKDLIGTLVEGSVDNTNWDTLFNFTGVINYWNNWLVPVNQESGDNYPVYNYRYYRLYQPFPRVTYAINEIEWSGVLIQSVTSDSTTCPITLQLSSVTPALTQTPSTKVSYTAASTPSLTSMSPLNGTTLGGTTLTLTGTGFGSTSSAVNVAIDGVNCAITSITPSTIVCTTGARPAYAVASLAICVEGLGCAATGALTYLYADLWSSPTTWGGETPPRPGESVVIPQGLHIILDQPTGLLNLILIQGSLVVADMPGITIDAYYIFIFGGSLQIGTESSHYTNEISITLHGNRTSPALPYYGNKFIAVRGGSLDIHGLPKTPSWTTLLQTAPASSVTITLSGATNWAVGDSIVIASTSYDYTEAEVKSITAITGNTLTLDSPLQFGHYANTEILGSDTMEIRAEVGVLSRNIKIQGSAEGRSDEHGVHVMLYSPGDESSIGRIENLEISYAGQAYSLGRYPLHFHMIGKVSKSYVRNNAIYNTYNRAVTVHGVQYFRVMENVAYNIKGHTFFIEDGIETQNRIEGNLGLSTHPSYSLLNTDQAPATFWITNPNNFIRNNHAAGGSNYGFWISLDPNPTGPSATPYVCPQSMQLGAFENNTSHTYGKYGFRIFPILMPLQFPCSPHSDTNPYITTYFYNHTSWKCMRNGAIAEQIADLRFSGFKVADNILAGLEVTYAGYSDYYTTTRCTDCVVVGNSGNGEGLTAGAKGVVTPQTDGFLLENTRLYNFDDTQYIFGDESHSVQCPVFDSGARLVKFSGVTITNCTKKIAWGSPHRGIFQIIDDSSFLPNGSSLLAPAPHLLDPYCVEDTDYLSVLCTGPNAHFVRRVTLYNELPSVVAKSDVQVLRNTGTDFPMDNVTINGITSLVSLWSDVPEFLGQNNHRIPLSHSIALLTGYNYSIFWGSGIDPLNFNSLNIEQDIIEPGDYVFLNFNFTSAFTNISVTRGPKQIDADQLDPTKTNICQYVNRSLEATDPSGTYTFDNVTMYLTMIISGTPMNPTQAGDLTVTRIKPPPLVPETITSTTGENYTQTYWSDNATWTSNTQPLPGDFVYINSDQYVILDINTPIFQYIEVNGILEFDVTKNVSLNANWIFVRAGKILSGNSSYPVPANASHSIVLHGEPSDPTFYFSTDISEANKILVVAGSIEMYGFHKKPYTLMEQNSNPGDTFIFVDSVDWVIGDEIVIATGGFYQEDEVFTITNIIQDYQLQNGFLGDSDWVLANNFRNYGKDFYHAGAPGTTTVAPYTQLSKIYLNGALQYYHSGAPLVIGGNVVDMRCEVALLNRNVKIVGDDNGWQGLVVVNDYTDAATSSGTVVRQGTLILDSVQFDNLGQAAYLYSGIRFIKATGYSSITNSVIANSGIWAVEIPNAQNLVFNTNTIYNTPSHAFVADLIVNCTINSNLFLRTYYVDDILVKKIEPSAVTICGTSTCSYTFSNNRIAGSDGVGMEYQGDVCGPSSGPNTGNIIRSADYGLWITSTGGYCIQAYNFTISFTFGAVSPRSGSPSINIYNFYMVENLQAVNALLSYEGTSVGHLGVYNSLVVGESIHSYCSVSNCSNVDCSSRTGIFTSTSTTGMPGTMFSPRSLVHTNMFDTDPHLFGQSTVSSVTFANFGVNNCQIRDFVLSTSDQGPDYTFPLTMTKTTNINIDGNSLAIFVDPNPKWRNEDDCGIYNCTGPLNVLITDTDGGFTGFKNGGYLLPNNPGLAQSSLCNFSPVMNSYVCDQGSSQSIYEILLFKSLDADSMTRTLSPINVTTPGGSFVSYYGNYFFNQLETFMDHSWSGFYTLHLKSSIFPSIIYTDQYYNISLTSTVPSNMQFQLMATGGKKRPIIVSIWCQNPLAVLVYDSSNSLINGNTVTGSGISDCTFYDSHGTNRWFYEENILQFVMSTEEVLYIRQSAYLQINMRMNMNLADFYSNNGPTAFVDRLAAVLNIPTYTIRIANVKSGSVILDMQILSQSQINNPTSTITSVAAETELMNLQDTLLSMVANGTLASSLGVVIMEYTSGVNVVSENTASGGNSGNSGNGNSGGDFGGNNTGIFPDGSNNLNNNKGKTEFKVSMDDWVIALFVGIIFVLIIAITFSGRKIKLNPVKLRPEIGLGTWNHQEIQSGKGMRSTIFAQPDNFEGVHKVSPHESFNP